MSYDAGLHGAVPGNHFVTPSSTSYSAPWTHEAEIARKDLPPPNSFSPPTQYTTPSTFGSEGVNENSHYPSKSSGAYVNDAHGVPYHYGTTWDSASLQDRYEASSWVTTSSGNWTAYGNEDCSPTTPHLNYDYSTSGGQLSSVSFGSEHSYGSPHTPQVNSDRASLPIADPVLETPPILVPSQHPQYRSEAPPSSPPKIHHPVPTVPGPYFDSYDRAHLPVPPEKYSPHSELMPNVIFLQKLREEELMRAQELAEKAKRPPSPVLVPKQSRKAPSNAEKADITVDHAPPGASSTKRRKKTSSANDANAARAAPAREGSTRSVSSKTRKSLKDLRKPSLACTFCRERKISCGRPPPGSPDPTCNQCARRSFNCTYMTEHSGKSLGTQRQ